MNSEGIDLERRAAIHAALSDPARLRVVDTLVFGDVSPSDLSEQLGMPSNLLAHHLGVLEREGLIARTRSEGDRRRTYVRLLPEALRETRVGGVRHASRLLFVCTANSARSVLAAALWSRMSAVPAVSAGTRPAAAIAPGTVAVASRHGLDLSDASPARLDAVARPDDFVVTVCDSAREAIGPFADAHWSIPDPVEHGDEAFDAAYDQLVARVEELADRIEPAAASTSRASKHHLNHH